jgi:Fibronectin type III domain
MQQPTRGPLTSINSLQINWVALQGDLTGSSLIDSYNLQWDNGTNSVTWTDLSGDGIISSFSTLTTLQITNGVVAGTTYNIRVRARNALGWSVWSSVL